jgi:LuxR family transcriptional regulator, activator of conjugal transfer of Ti plasmids
MASLGFGHWIYTAVTSLHKPSNMDVSRISSYPKSFVDDYNRNHFSQVDPSTPYWITHKQPASYRKIRRSVTLSAKQKELMNLNWDNRVNKGIAIPLSNVLGFKAMLALSFDGSIEELNAYIEDVQEELFSASQAFNREILSRHKSHFLNLDAPLLTPQQTKVMTLLTQGLLTKQIADSLCISANGVDKHIANIKSALSAKTTAEAVALSVQWGLI